MKPTTKKDNTLLEQAYTSIYEEEDHRNEIYSVEVKAPGDHDCEEVHPDESHEEWKEKEEAVEEGLDAADLENATEILDQSNKADEENEELPPTAKKLADKSKELFKKSEDKLEDTIRDMDKDTD